MVGLVELGEGLFDKDGEVDTRRGHDLQKLSNASQVVVDKSDVVGLYTLFDLFPMVLDRILIIQDNNLDFAKVAQGVFRGVIFQKLFPLLQIILNSQNHAKTSDNPLSVRTQVVSFEVLPRADPGGQQAHLVAEECSFLLAQFICRDFIDVTNLEFDPETCFFYHLLNPLEQVLPNSSSI